MKSVVVHADKNKTQSKRTLEVMTSQIKQALKEEEHQPKIDGKLKFIQFHESWANTSC